MSSTMGKFRTAIELSSLADGDSIAAYLTSASGALLTNTTIGGKEYLDAKSPADFLSGTAYASGTDYLQAMGVVDNAGNWVPFTLNASGELPVSAAVTFPSDFAEDSPHTSGDIGNFGLAVRRDVRTSGTDTDGDYASFNVNANGEMWVHDADAITQLTTANSTLTTIASNTGTTASNTGTTASTLTALSKAEDAAHSSGDQGIQALAVRKDAQDSNVSADGDYASLLTWSEGSLKVVDVANGSMLQQQVSVTTTATALPTAALANRKTIMVQNAGASSIWIGSATVTTTGATTGIELPKSSFIELEVGPAVTVYGRVASGTVNANVLEMG